MKLTTLFIFALCLHASARINGQQVTLQASNQKLEQVFRQIKAQTGYVFIYNDKDLAKARPVSVDLRDLSITAALDKLLQGQQLTYEIKGNTIFVSAKEEKLPPQTAGGINQPAIAPAPPVVHGRVTDEKGEPVVGVSISIKGGKIIGLTDNNGEFRLSNVDDDAVLVFSAVTIETFETRLNGRTELALNAKNKVSELEEVVINKGYYTEKQKYSVGNVGKVTASDIEKQPVSNPLLALQGRVPGLFITQANGLPGTGVTVRIQGQNSISGAVGKDPLYVVDGVPYVEQLLPTLSGILGGSGGPIINGVPSGNGNPLSFINPNDIEAIEILKDADATAIYGARAANGAILITTKKGKVGQTSVTMNLQTGLGEVSKKIQLLNTQQYLQMRREALKNDASIVQPSDYDLTFWDTTRYTDWQKELIGGTASYTNVQANITGGSANTQFVIGTGYRKETTVYPGNFGDQKGSLHFSINNISNNRKFQAQLSGSYSIDNSKLFGTDLTSLATQLAPNAPALYNSDGSLNWMQDVNGTSTWFNPLAYQLRTYINKSSNLLVNAVLGYALLPGLEIKSNFGFTDLRVNEFSPNPLIAVEPENRPNTSRTASYLNSQLNSWIIEPQITYKKRFNNNNVEFLLGSTILQRNSSYAQLSGKGYNSDEVLEDIKSASTVGVGNTGNSIYKYSAFFARANYNWREKYIVNLTGRRDGSSRFGSQNQFHNFWSAGIGWIFSNEKSFHELSFLSFGKIRASYGTTGNDQIGDYQYLNLFTPITAGVNYQNIPGLDVRGLSNPYLQWEETKKLQVGIDLTFFHERLFLTANYVHNRSSNQLLAYVLPNVTGFGSITSNFPATVQNTAWECAIRSKNITSKNFQWTSNFNLTVPRNRLAAFPNLASSSYSSSLIIGESINVGKLFKFGGVDPNTGIYQFIDSKGNTTTSPVYGDDQVVLVNPDPKFYGGLENSFSYKGLQLSISFQFVKQLASNNFFGNIFGAYFNTNQPISVLNRWTKPGDLSSIQRYNQDFSLFSQTSLALSSDASVSDASFVRLKNLALSWQLPATWIQKAHLQNCRIYLEGQNLLTMTKYDGLDPETKSVSSLPPLRVVSFGVQVGL